MTLSAKVAVIQTVSSDDLSANLAQAQRGLEAAAAQGACMAVLPENFALFGSRHLRALGERETSGDAPVSRFLAETARRLGLWIVGGSVPLAHRPDGQRLDERVRAACLVYDAQGQLRARYDKIHLFDADVGDAQGRYRESDTFEPGSEPVVVDTPVGRLGLAICYDLRFPELFRKLRAQGAELLALPAAFTWKTGQAHWEVLLRARAIENQVWVCASGQGGIHDEKRHTWGHSMIINPWGEICACHAHGEGTVSAAVDREEQQALRERMPVHHHIRLS